MLPTGSHASCRRWPFDENLSDAVKVAAIRDALDRAGLKCSDRCERGDRDWVLDTVENPLPEPAPRNVVVPMRGAR